ncbi:alanine--tRNA ligase [bacterium]|nr:alanine--tRNA ligase [bacterium]
MKHLTYKEIRDKYIQFFKDNNHKEIPSSPLVPEDDPSVLFVNAGMLPLVPFLTGTTHPKGPRLVNSQRCLRTGDIDEVGDNFHCTTFEMLGNWSLNDYFKKEAITLTVKFFVEELGLDINKIYATVFEGEKGIPQDNESIGAWEEIFKSYDIDAKVGKGERIEPLNREENWWGLPTGGPCGPDSEIFYKLDNGELVEIGNNVFMEYLLEDGKYKPLGIHNVDFGGGLDRLTTVIQEVDSIFQTDIYKPILEKVKEISNNDILESQRIIVDHIKAATWIVMDGVIPSKSQQGYILRRLIRRAVRHGKKLNIGDIFTREIATIAIDQFKVIYPQLEDQKEYILNIIEKEEKAFNNTIKKGLKILEKMLKKKSQLTGEDAFTLYETYGFPIELTKEILKERKLKLTSPEDFDKAEVRHQEKSRTSSSGMFKGGLADSSEMSTHYHTATHLLLAALRQVLGEQVYQKGSNITPERLRLDYPNDNKLTPEQITKVENIVNEVIEKGLEISFEEVSKEKALELVPFAAFSEKYGDTVKLYYIGPKENPFSLEICNGPHVSNTNELGKFKISKQENVGAGTKRIKAILQ